MLLNGISFYNKLVLYLNINVSDILDRACEKYMIGLNELDRIRLLSCFDDRNIDISIR